MVKNKKKTDIETVSEQKNKKTKHIDSHDHQKKQKTEEKVEHQSSIGRYMNK